MGYREEEAAKDTGERRARGCGVTDLKRQAREQDIAQATPEIANLPQTPIFLESTVFSLKCSFLSMGLKVQRTRGNAGYRRTSQPSADQVSASEFGSEF